MSTVTPASNEGHRLAIVLSHPVQYYSPWFRWMRAHTDLDFRVFYLDESGVRPSTDEKFQTTFAWDVDLTSGYACEFVPNEAARPDTLRFGGLHNPELGTRLDRYAPDVVLLFGYKYRTHLRLILRSRLRRVPLIFRGDSHLIGRSRLPLVTRVALRVLYRQFTACTCVGRANRDYFLRCGVDPRRLFLAPHAVDATRFDPEVVSADATRRQREELGIPAGHRVLLFSGKWIEQKQPVALLRAFLEARRPPSTLVIAGDGPECSALRALAQGSPDVRFLGFANQQEMPLRYTLADVFALPSQGSYETWGLAVNEAMQMGVPCLVSTHVGCQPDLVTPGETGWVFRAGDPGALRSAVEEALAAPGSKVRQMGVASRERISHYSYARATEGLRAALAFSVPR